VGHGDHNLIGGFAFGHQLALACAELDLRLPTDGLDLFVELLEAQVEMPTDFGRNRYAQAPSIRARRA
jgi:hypothetical protein